jgi:hypothetical protein
MKKLLPIIVSVVVFASCNSKESKTTDIDDNKISLHSDTINVVKLKDTLVIYESTCRGCAYEMTTDFEVRDSLGIVKLHDIHTINNSSSDMSGGSISKHLILVPQKTGTTTFKLFKYWGEKTRAKDSLDFTPYTITVTN